MKAAIAYYRVSTDRQGVSGLGIEAQKHSVDTFCGNNDYQVTNHYDETESGKKSDRPKLLAALKQCKKEKATLIIAKLDRLSRNVSFISSLMDSGVKFVACDNPHANELMIHMLAAFAQHERKAISTRTKEALAAAKKRGVQLGTHGKNVLSKSNRDAAQVFATSMKPTVEQLQKEGFKTIRAIATELNNRDIPTYRGQEWHVPTVFRLLKAIATQGKKPLVFWK